MIESHTIAGAAGHNFNRNGTKRVESVDAVASNLIEIVARLLQYQNNPADIPAYLRHDLLEWLRNHG